MKKIVVLLIFLLLASFLYADFQIGLDAALIDAAFLPSIRSELEFGYLFNNNIRLSIPLRYATSFKYDFKYLETALIFTFFPIENEGFLIGCSLFQGGYMFGLEAPDKDAFLLSGEGFIGWQFKFPYSYIEPRFVFTNTFSSEDEKLTLLKSYIPQFFSIHLSLHVGVRF